MYGDPETTRESMMCRFFDHRLELGLFQVTANGMDQFVFCTRCKKKIAREATTDPLEYDKLSLKCHNIDKKSFMQSFKENHPEEYKKMFGSDTR